MNLCHKLPESYNLTSTIDQQQGKTSKERHVCDNEMSDRKSRKVSDRRQPKLPGTGLTKGEIKHKQEQANKKPSASTIKVKEKKAKTKERSEQRKESEDFQTNKAEWETAKVQGSGTTAPQNVPSRISAEMRSLRRRGKWRSFCAYSAKEVGVMVLFPGAQMDLCAFSPLGEEKLEIIDSGTPSDCYISPVVQVRHGLPFHCGVN